MNFCRVNYFKKGQIKIQQMAFVLVALIVFFGIVSLFYFSISYSGLKKDVEEIREQEIIETVRKMTGTPEFTWTIYDCASCIDMDKVFALKDRQSYKEFWRKIPFLQVVRVYPTYDQEECVKGIYPDCNAITIIEEDTNFVSHSAFVSLCRYDAELDFNRCELGKIIMGFEAVE